MTAPPIPDRTERIIVREKMLSRIKRKVC